MRTNISTLALTAALMLAITFTLSCSGNSDDGTEAGKSSSGGTQSSSSQISIMERGKIIGVSQKGPFVRGSAITLYELNDKLAQTGRSFEATITDDKGSFEIEIKDVELASPYVMLKANGYYRNEVSGNISTPINLYAIADIREKSNVNVNILTHLELNRVQKLVGDGKSLKDAKKQAQKEILAVFGISEEFKDSEDMSIFGTSDGDAALLAISVLLQGELSEGQFTERLADFNLGFRETGTWDNKTEKDAMVDWAFGVYLDGIRSNILDWNLSSAVPDFEKYVNNYWYVAYGLVACDAKKAGEMKDVPFSQYICKDNAWVRATEYESDVGGLGSCSTAGEIKKGNVNDERYVRYTCKNNVWVITTKCLESKSCQTFTDARDNQTYYYVKIGTQTWMAENLNYDTKTTGSVCYDNDPSYCNLYGRLYNWETAKKSCPTGWHLPSNEEWQELVDFAGGNEMPAGFKLKATSGWYLHNGTDDYGFSALPGGDGDSDGSFSSVGYNGSWWSSSEYNSDLAYSWRAINDGSMRVYWYYDGKSYLYSVRCLQD